MNVMASSLELLCKAIEGNEQSELMHLICDIKSSWEISCQRDEIGFFFSSVFGGSFSVLDVIKKLVQQNKWPKCQEECLSLLQDMTPLMNRTHSSYIKLVLDTCFSVLRSSRSSVVKEKTIAVIISMIEVRDANQEGRDIEFLRKLCNEELAKKSGTSSSVKGSCFHLLGMLAQHYPDKMTDYSDRLLSIYLRHLKFEFRGGSDLKLLEGCLKGLSCLMVNFSDSVNQSTDTSAEVFKYTVTSIQPRTDLSRFAVPAAGLRLLQLHASHFTKILLDQYESVYAALENWFNHRNRQMKHEAHLAILSVLKVVANAGNEIPEEQAKKLFLSFTSKFQKTLEISHVENKAVSLAIQGFGLFAGLCGKFMPSDHMQKMLSMVMDKCIAICRRREASQATGDDHFHLLPSFLFSLGNIIPEVIKIEQKFASKGELSSRSSVVDDTLRRSLITLCVYLMRGYFRLNEKFSKSCCTSLVYVMAAFSSCPDHQKLLVSDIVYKGLIICGSAEHMYGDMGPMAAMTEDSRLKSSKDYLELWIGLICCRRKEFGSSFDSFNYTADFVATQRLIFTEVLASIDVLISKLDTSLEISEDIVVGDQMGERCSDVPASGSVDLNIFERLSDLISKLLPSVTIPQDRRAITRHHFISNAHWLIRALIKGSIRYPNIAGFYTMLSKVMRICIEFDYFSDMDNIDGNQNFIPERRCCILLIRKFAQEICSDMEFRETHILISSLYFILSLPEPITRNILHILAHPLQISFHFGLSSPLLADAAVDAMLRWRGGQKAVIPDAFLPVLPDLVPFLPRITSDKPHETSSLLPQRKKRLRLSRQATRPVVVTSDRNIRHKVVRYLGSLGGISHYCLGSTRSHESSEYEEKRLSRATASLSYAVPFQHSKVDLRLDYFLPLISRLALSSAVKQTRITACEVLHSLTVYVVGKSAQLEEDVHQQHPMTETYRFIVPVVLQLACDVEPVCQKLFAPLAMQLIRWLTRSRRCSSSITIVLLNSILDGLVSEGSGALRDFCATAAKEFLIWSIKQDVASENNSRKNSKFLFKRISSFARHPSALHRLGAAVAFKHIYSVFREVEHLVDEFTLDLLVTYLDSLCMAEDDNDIVGTRKAIKEALQHIKRIIVVKSDLLNKISSDRRMPSGFMPYSPVTLSSVALWLMDQCSRSQTDCRHTCMELLVTFIPLLPEKVSAQIWMKKFVEKSGLPKLIASFEGGTRKAGIALYPRISLTLRESKLESAMCWFDFFLTTLDCFMWVIKERLLTPTQVFVSDGFSNFFSCIEHFLSEVAYADIGAILGDSDVWIHTDCDKFQGKKCTVTIRILQFTTLMLSQFCESSFKVFPETVWTSEMLLGVVATCIVHPSDLGFYTDSDLETGEKLRILAAETTKVMLNKFPEKLKEEFINLLRVEVTKNGSLLEQLSDFSKLTRNVMKISQLISAYKILAQNKIFVAEQDCVDAEKIINHVFTSMTKKADDNRLVLQSFSQQLEEVFDSLLNLAFAMGVGEGYVLRHITDAMSVHNNSGEELSTTRGQLFFVTFKDTLCHEMCVKSTVYFSALSHCCPSTLEAFIINELLEYLFSHRKMRQQYAATVCDNVLRRWKTSEQLCQTSDVGSKAKTMELSLFAKVCTLESKVCTNPDHPDYARVFELFKGCVTSPAELLKDKLQVLPSISLLANTAEKKREADLKAVLFKVSSLHFPTSFNEFALGSRQYEDYSSALQILLFGLELTGSKILLEVLLPLFCCDGQHPVVDEFQSVLEKCMVNVEEGRQKFLMDIPYDIFADPSSPHSMKIKCKVFDLVLISLMQQCAPNAALEFFVAHIGDIMKCLLEEQRQGTSSEIQEQLSRKARCYRLAQAMFTSLSADQIKIESSPIVQAFAASRSGAGSTKFLKSFLGRAVRDKAVHLENPELIEETRLFHCALYNAIISAVVCTQTDIKWFDAFLFSDTPKKKEYLFENIIDKSKVYFFPVETEESQRKKIITLRSAFRKATKASRPDYESIVYASSLVGSSLSEDANHFDNNVFLPTRRGQQEDPSNEEDFLEVEGDALDSHECMHDLIKLIAHMKYEKIGFSFADCDGVNKKPLATHLPKWLNSIVQKLDSTPHLNVKLFIIKLIINCEAFLQEFADCLLAPLMRALLAYLRSPRGGDAIDQLVVDALVTMLSWSPFSIPKDCVEDKILVRALIEILMKNAKHAKRGISLRNMDLIKTMVECWRERVDELNTDIIFENFTGSDPDNFIGLCLLEVLLANGLPAYSTSSKVDREDYFRRVFSNTLSSKKAIVDLSGKVMGLTLQYFADQQTESSSEIENIAHGILEKLSMSSKSGVSKLGVFITSLHQVSSQYPPIAMPFLELVLYYMPKLPGTEIKVGCVDVLRLSMEKIDNPVATLKPKGFIDMMMHRDEGLQYSCLRLCSAMLRKTSAWGLRSGPYDPDKIQRHQDCVDFLLPTLSSCFPSHPNQQCRQELYEIAMLMYDVQSQLPEQYVSEDSLKVIKQILVQGLNDTEELLRTKIVNFWTEGQPTEQGSRVPADSGAKTVWILKDWYQAELDEVGFLSSFCNLLMQNTSRSLDFEQSLFDHALAECTFQLQTVHTNMLGSSAVTTSSHSVKLVPGGQTKAPRLPMVLATPQNLEFSATIATQDKYASSWMGGESISTFSDVSEESHVMKRTSKIDRLSVRRIPRRRWKSPDSDFGSALHEDSAAGSEVIDLNRLKRRFLKDSSKDYRFARIASEKKKREKSKRAGSGPATLQIYRSYRIGELPDIQIPHRALISPMTALAHDDPVFLQRYMSALIHGVSRNEKDLGNSKYLEDLSHAFTHVLNSSEHCDSTFIGFVLDVIQQNASVLNVSPSVLSKAAIKANQQSLGIRAIEEWLISQETPKEPTPKRRKLIERSRNVSPTEILAWIELARLNQADYDTLLGIFAKSPIARPLFSRASSHQVHGEYVQALRIYQEALMEDNMSPEPSDIEKDLWEDCLINCLRKLGRWQDLDKFCNERTDGFPGNIWKDEHIEQRFLSTSLHAKIILLLQGDVSLKAELMNFFESSNIGTKARREAMERKYCEYVVMLHTYKKEYETAHHYLRNALDVFADTWTKTFTSNEHQHFALSKLLHLSDMMDFLELMSKSSKMSLTPQMVEGALEQWSHRLPHATFDSFEVWEDILAYRGLYLERLTQCRYSEMVCDNEISLLQKKIVKSHFDLTLKAADEASKRKYFTLSRELLSKNAQNIIETLNDQGLTCHEETTRLHLSMSNYYLTFAKHKMSNDRENYATIASKAILESFRTLKEAAKEENYSDMVECRLKMYTLFGWSFQLALDMFENESDLPNCLEEMISEGVASDKKMGLLKSGQSYLHEGITLCQENSNVSHDDVAKIYMTYAGYCDKFLQNNDMNKVTDGDAMTPVNEIAGIVITFGLRAMHYHGTTAGGHACLKFPRLLQLIEAHPGNAKKCFLTEANKLPVWLFLRWISQMVALLDTREADAIHSIIRHLAAEYPQAVIYPLKTSCQDFAFGRDECGKKNKAFVSRLHSSLNEQIPVVQHFIQNLTLLTSPSHAFKEWYEDTVQIFRRKDKTAMHKVILTKYQNMYQGLFGVGPSTVVADDDDDDLPSARTGSYWNDFAKKFRTDVDKAFGGPAGGQCLMDEKRFIQAARKICQQMTEYCRSKKPQKLSEYSQWLSDFHSFKFDHQDLEMPGQYKGTCKPKPEFHLKIVSFDEFVLVMSSLQQPKKITIKASDCKDYQFLIKGNEDLRQDQRIQQLFGAMNITFQQEPLCAERNLHINTYQVIPVTSRLGMIEWVDSTRTLHDLVYSEAMQCDKIACLDAASQTYSNWLAKYSSAKKTDVMYGNMMSKANYTEVHQKYLDVLSCVPRNLLRNAYLKLSSSAEHFLMMRKAFALSYGSMCAAHWILGIGDRHTSNCLISLHSGEAVGIDFGHAFGTATEILPVPELVPFRLSPQLCHLMAPHSAKHGRLQQSMLLCLSTLKENQDTVLTMLDVFLKEPSIDWLKHANSLLKVRGTSVSSPDLATPETESSNPDVAQWYPLRKIERVKKKLSGCHPSKITLDELQHNFRVSKAHLSCYKAVATGMAGKCLRMSKQDGNLDVNDQVNYLIDQATDPNVVGRSYIGWRYWI